MKILLTSSYAKGDTSYFVDRTLRKMGHDVQVIKWPKVSFVLEGFTSWARIKFKLMNLQPVRSRMIRRAGERLRLVIRGLTPDLILVLKGDGIPPEMLLELRQCSQAALVNWFPDALANLENRYVFESIRIYGFFFVKDLYLKKQLEKVGFQNIYYLPQAFDPDIHRPVDLTSDEKKRFGCDLCVLGTCYPYRLQLIRNLRDYDMRIWGAGWNLLGPKDVDIKQKWMGRSAVGEKKAKVLGASKIVLNLHHYSEVLGINKRTFEVAGVGAFQLVGKTALLPDRDGLGRVFEPDKEIVCFENVEDLRQKIDYYLSHPEERRAIARRAYERAHREHSYENRLQRMLEIIAGG